MYRILLAVDGSESAVRATKALIDHAHVYKEMPKIDLVTVHRPIPNVGTLPSMITSEMRDRYYQEDCDQALAPSTALLDAAKIPYTVHRLIGPVAETIVQAAKDQGADAIWMGTHGRTGMANIVMGSIATKVVGLSPVPVRLNR